MTKTKEFRFRLHRFFCFIAALVFCAAPKGYSQSAFIDIDTTSKTAQVFAEDDAAASYTVAESNVEFPEILKGNEDATLGYIEKFSERRRDYLIRMYIKGKKLLPKAAGILKKHNLPEELKVLMILESAYNPNAVSKAGAVGYWQFMDAVAKEYGLRYVAKETKMEEVLVKHIVRKRGRKIMIEKKHLVKVDVTDRKGKNVDDRKNFNKATAAAARYLRDRRVNLDDNWLLVVASYNCGVGNVWNAMERCGKKNPDFWDIKNYLPQETQAYVMNFITLNVVYSNYDKFLKNKMVFRAEKSEMPEDNFEDNVADELANTKTAAFK